MGDSSLQQFAPATRAWFEATFEAPTLPQTLGWPAIASGSHTLIHAPTGSGKTLAAFLWTLDRLCDEPLPPTGGRCRLLYISPLKALAYDIERNLRAPLAGIRHAAARIGAEPPPVLTTFMRTGDTPASDRQKMLRRPPDILITTPESLYLMLTSAARERLAPVRWVIVDEVHAVAGTKRGAHLAVSLERLEETADAPPQRIGLSATQRPLETIARFLGGGSVERPEAPHRPRPVTIVDADHRRPLELELVVPSRDMTQPEPVEEGEETRSRSIWPSIYRRLLDLIQQHTSTIVFTNSRRLAERVCAELNNLAAEEIARAHHGSVARRRRLEIEDGLKRGQLRAVVATSSLELGIDMGAVDLVIQIESPTSVASGLQRVGRSGHQVGGTSRAKLFPKYRGDLLTSTVVAQRMRDGQVESTVIPANPIDVAAQQIVAAVVASERSVDDLYLMLRRAAPFADLSREVFLATLDMLAGRYPSDLFAELRPRVVWDRMEDTVKPRSGARQLAVTNAGVIPDRGLYRVQLPDGSRVGELDEEMVYESRPGDVFLLGSSSWRIGEITHDRIEVTPAPGVPGQMPFWRGDTIGRSAETGLAIGRFLRETSALAPEEAERRLTEQVGLDRWAAENLVAYLEDQRTSGSALPDDRTVVVERFRDEIGDWRMVVLSPLGARIHAPWAMAAIGHLRSRYGIEIDAAWSDDGIIFRFPDADDPPSADDILLTPDQVSDLLMDHLSGTALFASRFREAAGRALLLPRRRPGYRTPLWLQRRRAADLLSVARRFDSFPIILETYREVLQDDFDLPYLRSLLTDLRSRKVRLVEVELLQASPFATSLMQAFLAGFLYETDGPAAERKAMAITLDRHLLSQLLGEGEIGELISPDVVASLELELQHLTEERRVRGADGVHDLLRRLGPLSRSDLDLRAHGAGAALEELRNTRRVIGVTVAARPVWAAVEDAARLRDALGCQLPPGVPAAFSEPVEDPLGDVVSRYARTHGPFPASQAAAALGLPTAVTEEVLSRLAGESRVIGGVFRAGGPPEWVDTEVLRRLKRRSLASLRRQVEPVDSVALARFLTAWHRVGDDPPGGPGSLLGTIAQIQGCPVPASMLESDILAARHSNPTPRLDQLLAEGRLIWVGRGSLGRRDGKVALYLRDRFSQLDPGGPEDPPDQPLHRAIREHLDRRGASFFAEILQAAGGEDLPDVVDALWDLVWAGLVTNDSLHALRAHLRARRSPTGRRRNMAFPPDTAGRWSLVPDVSGEGSLPATEHYAALGIQLLDRHGIVTRSVVAAEGIRGGFTGIYPVLARLEETGKSRRGYFIEGLGGAQFALAGAVDRLREESEPRLVVLAATDPANPYGAAIPWPKLPDVRFARAAGCYVALWNGELAAFLNHRRLTVRDLDDLTPETLAEGLAKLGSRHRRFRIDRINELPAGEHPLSAALQGEGFAVSLKGLGLPAKARRY
nr:DEAD/DEAH box helicase [bacterium]